MGQFRWSAQLHSNATMTRLALGTVQFGLRYGVANQTGQVSTSEAADILKLAAQNGIDTLDTAIAYGSSEERLGQIGVSEWKVITKLPPFPSEQLNAREWVLRLIEGSLDRLKIQQLDGLLLHRSADLLDAHGAVLYQALRDAQKCGMVRKIGVSIYDPGDLDDLLARFDLQLVQAPFNIIDRRLERTGWLSQLHGRGIEVHVRSVFLQGLLLMRTDERPERFVPWQSLWKQWHEWLCDTQMTPVAACLRFALSHPEIAKVVVGVDSESHLQTIVASAVGAYIEPPDELSSSDPKLINPLSWLTS